MFDVELIQREEFGAWSVKLKNNSDGLYYWVDVHIDRVGTTYGDIVQEWNQYIFHTDNDEDQHRMEVQDDATSYDFAQSEALSALLAASEIIERDDGYYEINEAPAWWGRTVEIIF